MNLKIVLLRHGCQRKRQKNVRNLRGLYAALISLKPKEMTWIIDRVRDLIKNLDQYKIWSFRPTGNINSSQNKRNKLN